MQSGRNLPSNARERYPLVESSWKHIGIFKESRCKDLQASYLPMLLWYHCVERRDSINNMTVRDLCYLRGTNSCAMLHGKEGDMSNLCQFDWHDWVYHRANDDNDGVPFPSWNLGRVLGPSRVTGN